MLGAFRNFLYIRDNKVIILKPVLLRELRQVTNLKTGEITLFKNMFRIKTMDIACLIKESSTREHRNSRFTPNLILE